MNGMGYGGKCYLRVIGGKLDNVVVVNGGADQGGNARNEYIIRLSAVCAPFVEEY